MVHMRADATLKSLAGEETSFALPRSLITTDRILQRWAVSIGSGLPSDEWDDQPRAKPPPLSDDVAIEVDQCVLKSPPRTKSLMTRWYKTPEPVQVIAAQMSMSPRNVYRAHAICLEFMKFRFIETQNGELIRLVRRTDILDSVGT